MKTFKLDDIYSIKCEYEDLPSGFKHRAMMCENDKIIAKHSVKYDNRTWEGFEFESVSKQLIDICFYENERIEYRKKLSEYCFC